MEALTLPRLSNHFSSTSFEYGVVDQTDIRQPGSSKTGADAKSHNDLSTPSTPATPSTPLEKPVPGQQVEIDENIKLGKFQLCILILHCSHARAIQLCQLVVLL